MTVNDQAIWLVRKHTSQSNGMWCISCFQKSFGTVHHVSGPYKPPGRALIRDEELFAITLPYDPNFQRKYGYVVLCACCCDQLRMESLL